MFRNSENDNDTKAGHTRSGKIFKGIHVENLFKKNYKEEGFYSGEEADLTDEEHSEPIRAEEEAAEELHRNEPETLGTAQNTEVSNINPPIVLEMISNQNIQKHQSPHGTITSSSTSIQTRNLGNFMADKMRLPIFRGDGFEDLDQHWFLCEAIWNIKNITDEAIKRNQFGTMLRDHALRWYMKLFQGLVQPKPLNGIKNMLVAEFKKTNSESQCITELKAIK